MDLLERLPSGTAQLVYFDAPWYGVTESFLGGRGNPDTSLRRYLQFITSAAEQARRVLSETGFLVFHNDPTLTGNIRVLLDQLFGRENYRYEAVLPLTHMQVRRGPSVQHQTILYYSRSMHFKFFPALRNLSASEVRSRFSQRDSGGRYRLVDLTIAAPSGYVFSWKGQVPPVGRAWRLSLEKMYELESAGMILSDKGVMPRLKQYAKGADTVSVGSVWDDIQRVPRFSERTRHPRQQSLELLERVLYTTTEAADLVIDPFCGSGTTLVAAAKHDLRWIGADLLPDAIETTCERLRSSVGLQPETDYVVGDSLMLQEVYPETHRRETEVFLGTDETSAEIRRGDSRTLVYDVFISHASEDKDNFVRPLASALEQRGFRVWFDEFTLKVGDSLRAKIDHGLARSRFGLVVLSSAFFKKSWTQYELNGFVAREIEEGRIILPVWHKVSKDEVRAFSPSLADKVALNSSLLSIDELVDRLGEVIGGE